eukprot:1632098-Prymnesium_polylepis.5
MGVSNVQLNVVTGAATDVLSAGARSVGADVLIAGVRSGVAQARRLSANVSAQETTSGGKTEKSATSSAEPQVKGSAERGSGNSQRK